MAKAEKPDAKQLLKDMQIMIETDLMKACHYLKQSVNVALIAGDAAKAAEMATLYVELDDLLERHIRSYREIVNRE